MRVHVGGTSGAVKRKEWIEATHFYGRHLMPDKLREDILINLDLTSYTEEYGELEQCGGVVLPMIGDPMRLFNITVNTRVDLTRKDQLICLSHEMIHVEQIASGRFGKVHHEGQTKIKWNKSIMGKAEILNLEAPWEVEAYAGERKMFIKYEKSLRYRR